MKNTDKTLKNKFTIFLIAAIILLMVLFVGIIYYKLSGIKTNTIRSKLETTINNVESEMGLVLGNIHSQLRIVREWGNNGLISFDDNDKLLHQFAPLLEQFKIIKSIKIVSDDGNSFILYKDKGNLFLYRYLPNGLGNLYVLDTSFNLISEKKLKEKIDLRKKVWFKRANTSDYKLFYYEIENPGNAGTMSIRWESKNSNKSGVAAFGISANFINRIYNDSVKTGFAVLIDNSGRILNISGLNIPEKIVKELKKKVLANSKKHFTYFSFKFENDLWWAGVRALKKNQNIFLSVTMSQKDILPDISKLQSKWYAILVAILVLVAFLIYLLIKSYKNSLNNIYELNKGEHIDKKTEILNLIQEGENSKLEFKSTVRMNLKSGKNGKEIEKAWLKNIAAFLNTEGGTVLLGVADNGEILGLSPDKFKNKDNCLLHITNLIKHHIGIEFNNYIDIDCITIDEKDIAVIKVKSSPEPAFLHMSDTDEEFYIRTGPSSVSLTISKAIKYINDKKNKAKK